MIRLMLLLSIWGIAGLGVENGLAASGKCTVVKVNGGRMVIECNEQAKGFTKGSKIKIKSERKKQGQKK